LSPLFSKVYPSSCTYSITPNKIEINLHKSTSGLKWSALEGTNPISDDKENKAPASATNPMEATASPSDKAPAYPTSSRKGAKDWDSVAANALTVEPIKGEPGKPHEDDDEDGDPLQGFFRKLYQGSDPDTRRAMMKSYTESNGTALSTNWADVGKGPVETKPPEGVEAKKWGT
jgi:suppressor of G2 allele of SKP1